MEAARVAKVVPAAKVMNGKMMIELIIAMCVENF
jgi:hypothetical protein